MQHTGTMIRMTALLLAIASCLGAGYAIWRDLTNSFSASASLGKMWYDHAPQSLQLAETIVSRYIDPCGLIEALDCTPVFWHPVISTLLGWPAALVLIGFTIIFGWLGTRQRRARGRGTNTVSRGITARKATQPQLPIIIRCSVDGPRQYHESVAA